MNALPYGTIIGEVAMVPTRIGASVVEVHPLCRECG